jgi:hypothetical protein
MALGLDGYIYRLEQITKKGFVELPRTEPSDESKQRFKDGESDGEVTGPELGFCQLCGGLTPSFDL